MFSFCLLKTNQKYVREAFPIKHIRSDTFGEHKFTTSIRVKRSALATRWPDAGPTLARHSFSWPDAGLTLARRWPDTNITLARHICVVMSVLNNYCKYR